MNIIPLTRLFVAAASVAIAWNAAAQWGTQSVQIKAGWNAVYLHVDASHATLDALVRDDVNNPITEVWQWNPPVTTQFTDSPLNPNPGSEWTSWIRTRGLNSLQRLSGDNAYLVRVGTNVASYAWQIKGRPVPPQHAWTVTGLNLVGFPTVPAGAPNFNAFLAPSPEFQSVIPEVYYYPGGELGPNNPLELSASFFRSLTVERGHAYWVRAGQVFNDYFGPFEVLVGRDGVRFHDNLGTATVRLRNLSDRALTVSVSLAESEPPPPGHPPIASIPPLLLRGELDTTDLTYGYADLPSGVTRSWTLEPRGTAGSEREVVIGLNRSIATLPAGALMAGILQFTDSLGHTRVDVPVSATAASRSGLWVGRAAVDEVRQYLVDYARGTVTNTVLNAEGEYETTTTPDALLTTAGGRYIATDIDTSVGAVPQAYAMRLIVHNPDQGNSELLQRVFFGMDSSTNEILSRGQSALASEFLHSARRLSSVHLPWTADNHSWEFLGRLGEEPLLVTEVTVDYNDRESNPFVHAYHPDHDNLNATFDATLPQGSESYQIKRVIILEQQPPGDHFSSLVRAGLEITGNYFEIITLRGLARSGGTFDEREFEAHGSFRLSRVSSIPTLTPLP